MQFFTLVPVTISLLGEQAFTPHEGRSRIAKKIEQPYDMAQEDMSSLRKTL